LKLADHCRVFFEIISSNDQSHGIHLLSKKWGDGTLKHRLPFCFFKSCAACLRGVRGSGLHEPQDHILKRGFLNRNPFCFGRNERSVFGKKLPEVDKRIFRAASFGDPEDLGF
jgi:hypothetical protein